MNLISRRRFLATSAAAGAAISVAPHLALGDDAPRLLPKGKAEHCIFVWLGGGAGQIDTWDPKQLGDPKAKQAGSYYPAIDTAIPGVGGAHSTRKILIVGTVRSSRPCRMTCQATSWMGRGVLTEMGADPWVI